LLTADEFQAAGSAWGIRGPAPLDAGHLPMQLKTAAEVAEQIKVPEEQAGALLRSAQQKLLMARSKRMAPKDDKKLAAWNGLALSALVAGARLPDGVRYRAAANRVRDYLAKVLWNGTDLYRAVGGSGALGAAALEDYAFVARGLTEIGLDELDIVLIENWPFFSSMESSI